MLNELSQVVESLDRLGVAAPPRHPRINPMGKNRDLLVVCLASDGKATRVEVLAGDVATNLHRVEHGSAGSSFPGFNVPTPLRCLHEAPEDKLRPVVEHLLTVNNKKDASAHDLSVAVAALFSVSKARDFAASQQKQFQRSCSELVDELREKMAGAPAGLANFLTLLALIAESKPALDSFASSLAELLAAGGPDGSRGQLLLFQDVLFGALDWKKRLAPIASPDYWKGKAKQDKNTNQPIYLDLANPDARFKRVAHRETSAMINDTLVTVDTSAGAAAPDGGSTGTDAFTGRAAPLQEKFPVGPKLAELGNLKLFSVNTNEIQALRRYKLEGSQSFPVAAALVQKMSDALLQLASEEKRGISCRAIPSSQPDKRDLLVTYIEGEPEFGEQMAEMFGGEAAAFSDADFAAVAQPVIEMLEGKAATNPNLNVRLLAFCPIDKAKKQISLNRLFRVTDVIQAAKDWQAGSRNVPRVSVWFYDKPAKQSVFRSRTTPSPLELATTANRVWSSDAKGGFASSFQRAMSAADAYEVFMEDSPLSRQKAERALSLLVQRMSAVLAALGAVRTTGQWASLSDSVRWHSLKTIALFGILLRQVGQHQQSFMQEPITQIGRLLALADSLHQQYCKHVRKSETPSQLIGNALFNTALEQPVFALARLAERLTPYQAWARTFQSGDPTAGVGLVKYFLGEIAACTAAIRIDELPDRMSDADKAKLLLGYLADHSKSETQES
jgi:hypothetical protein